MTQRNPIIDVCKGIGILLVVVGHLGTIWGSPIYMFHMSLFFILSGVCFSDKYLDQKVDFVRKRFVSIMLPFLLFKSLAYAVVHFFPWKGAAAFIDHYHLLGTLWFLKCLFLASVIGLVIIWGLRKVGCNKRWMPALVSIVLASILSMTIGDDNRAVFVWFTFHFLVGYAVKPYLGVLSDTRTNLLKVLTFGGGYYAATIVAFYHSRCHCGLHIYELPALLHHRIWGKLDDTATVLFLSTKTFLVRHAHHYRTKNNADYVVPFRCVHGC